MKNSLELKDEKALLKEQAFRMLETCKTEIREMTDEEKTKYEELKKQIETINQELELLEEKLTGNTDERADEEDENKEDNPTDTPTDTPTEDTEETKEEEKNKRNKTMEKKNFSLIKAIRNIANNKTMDELSAAVIEAGASEMRKSGLNYTGQIQLPSTEARAAITVATEGEDVVATDLMDIVKPLQAKNVMILAGAKFVTGLVGDVQYPVMSNANCAWEGETDAAADGAPTFTNVKLSPKRLATVVPISKQFLVQDSVGAEAAIREEIINAINAKIEATILGAGAGSLTEPKGMFPSEGDGSLTSITDFKGICDLEAGLEDANVYGDLKYIMSPKAKAALRGMSKGTKSTQLVYENGEVDGTTALSTSHVANNRVLYGDFSQYIIAQWGNIDITVDNVTLAADGQIRLIVNCYFDMKPLRNEAFATAKIGA